MSLLDSCFLIDLFDEDPAAIAKLEELEWQDASVSTITVTEVAIGLSRRERERFEGIVDKVDVLPYDLDVARRATDEQRRLRNEGRQIGHADLMIAATALESGKPVVTRNVTEFQRTSVAVTPY